MAEYTDREGQFDASLGNVMGGWMLDVAKADLARQQGWLEAIQLTSPSRTRMARFRRSLLASGITGADGKAISGADISFPVALALMGQQFAASEADLAMTMNVSASTLDETKGQQSGTARAKASSGSPACR